jgi:CBS domain-containing protein/uncharacterized protein (DUF2267 family)
MSLGLYVRPRLVVLSPTTPAFEAARAIENNNIGAVVVQERGQVVGIVTDRDLAVRVVGRGLDPKTTFLGDVMASPVATLSPAGSQADAVRLMRERNVRRIPLIEGDRLVGIVTLDDLLIDEAAPIDELAAVVAAQIGEGGPAASVQSPAAMRSAARAASTYGRLLGRVQIAAGLGSVAEAETALEVVLGSIVRRLTPDEARDFIAQLPSLLQHPLLGLPPGPDKLITLDTIESQLAQRLDIDPERASGLLTAIGSTIAQVVSPGQIENMQSQLPRPMRDVFAHSPTPAH